MSSAFGENRFKWKFPSIERYFGICFPLQSRVRATTTQINFFYYCRQRPFVKILHLYLDVSTFLSWFLAHNRFFAQNSPKIPKIHKFTPLHLQLWTGERKTKGCRVSPSDAPFQVTFTTIRFFLPNFRTRTVPPVSTMLSLFLLYPLYWSGTTRTE